MRLDFTRREVLKTSGLAVLSLSLRGLNWIGTAEAGESMGSAGASAYRGWEDLYRGKWTWDKVARSTHFVNCWYQSACSFNVYVKDGIVWREEQAAAYPRLNPDAPDVNPRGCQKGACFSDRMYDPSRVRYPLKRAGKRGEAKWQRVSWDQALSDIADQMIDTLQKEGPAAIQWEIGSHHNFGGPQGIGFPRLALRLDTVMWDMFADNGDGHPGTGVTCGKIIFSSSCDDMFYSDLILIWGGNPIVTQIPNAHFFNEARYKGAKVIAICPDYSPSSIHADEWFPVRLGSDAALALSICNVIVSEKRYNEAFLKEQTDMPLLVRNDTKMLLREADLKEGGAEDVFYCHDSVARKVIAAPRMTLALGSVDPALEGEYEVETRKGRVKVRPVFELLKRRLSEYAPGKAAGICGIKAEMIGRLAREIAAARGITGVTQSNFSKYYQGMEMERAQLLVFALTGNIGKKGGSFQAFPFLVADVADSGFAFPNLPLPEGRKKFEEALAPVAVALKDKGYTDEMISYEMVRQIFEAKTIIPSLLNLYLHGGLKDLMRDHRKWDRYMKRDLDEYVQLAVEKRWQPALPDVEPKIVFTEGSNLLRRVRGYPKLIEVLLPKLRLFVDVGLRMGNTARYADYVLPVAASYERDDVRWATPLAGTWVHGSERVVEPLGEALSEWKIHCLLAKKIQERAIQRNVPVFKDRKGQERRLDTVYEDFTYGGNYKENDDQKLATDFIKASTNLKGVEWDQLKKKGFANFSAVGVSQTTIGNATDLKPGQSVTPNTWHVEKKVPWPTLTRRMQFYIDHELFLELGDELPIHKEDTIGGNYPLRMITPHARHSIHAGWRDHRFMLRLDRGEPVLYLNPRDAESRQIADHDRISVFNDIGSFVIRTKISSNVPPGTVMLHHAWEPYQFVNGHSYQTLTPSPINPIELAGQYVHLRPMITTHMPGGKDRGTRVDVQKVTGEKVVTGLKL